MKTLTIAAFEYKPFVDPENPKLGYIAEITAAALKQSHVKVQFELYPLKRSLIMAKKGKVDGVLGAYFSPSRTYLLYSDPIGEVHINFITTKQTNLKDGSPEALIGVKAGVILGTSLAQELRALGLNIEEVPNNTMNLSKLLVGRLDVVIGTTQWILNDLTQSFNPADKERIRVLKPAYQKQKLFFTVSRSTDNAEDIIQQFNEGLREIKRNGEFNNIMNKYPTLKGF
jgi:polar amino acid transport system substrate-binding protein